MWRSFSLAAAATFLVPAGGLFAAVPLEEQDLQIALLTVTINAAQLPEPVEIRRKAGGAVLVPRGLLEHARIRLDGVPVFTAGGQEFVALGDVPGLGYQIDEGTQSLSITASPERFQETILALDERERVPMTNSVWGAFVNYDGLVSIYPGRGLNGLLEFGGFGPKGYGVSSFIGTWTSEGASVRRLGTSWTFDDPDRMRSLRLGDSMTRGGIGGTPLHFGGVQFARNFAVEPGFLTVPLPTVEGSAALPSVVDIYVDNSLLGRRETPPGPFSVTGIPVPSGNGQVQLVVRDLLGRETIVQQPYYTSPATLRAGLADYSYEVGFLRRDFGRRSNSYGDLLVSGTHRYGVTDWLTGEAHVEGTSGIISGGVSATLVVPGLGFLYGAAAASHSEKGSGALAAFSIEKRSPALSLGVNAEFATEHYSTIGLPPQRKSPAAIVQAFAGIPTPFGSIGATYLWRDSRDHLDIHSVNASASVELGNWGSLRIAGRKSLTGEKDVAAELSWILALGRLSSVSAAVQQDAAGTSFLAGIQRNRPFAGGFGYAANISSGAVDRMDARLSLTTEFGTYDAEVTRFDRRTGARLVFSGSVGTVGGEVFAARKLTESFAAVQVGTFEGVRVYADNQLIGRTNAKGVVIVPHLRAYGVNRLRYEVEDLPMDAVLSHPEQQIRPFNRSGVFVSFAAEESKTALLRALLEDGSPLPVGAVIRINGGEEEFLSTPEGDAYLTGLRAQNEAVATFDGKSCRFTFELPRSEEPQPFLGSFTCRSVQ